MRYLSKHKGLNFLTCLVIVINAGLFICSSLSLIEFLNSIVAQDVHRFVQVFSVFLIIWAFIIVFIRLKKICIAALTAKLNTDIRDDISALILEKSQDECNKLEIGEYLSWYTNDINQIETRHFAAYFNLVSAIAQTVFAVASLLYFHWIIAATTLALSAFMLTIPRFVKARLEKAAMVMSQSQGVFTGQIKDILMGLGTMRAFGMKSRYRTESHKSSTALEQSKFSFSKIQANNESIIDVVNVACQAVTNALLAYLSIMGMIPIGTIFGGGNIVGSVFNGLNNITQNIMTLSASKVILNKFTAPPQEQPAPCTVPNLGNGIFVDNLSFGYGETPVLQNLTANFEANKKYALVGPSGCGKSTLLKLLTKQLGHYQGKICFGETDIASVDDDALYDKMAYIPQEVFLFNSTIGDNITLGKDFSQDQIDAALQASSLTDEINAMPLGLDTPVGEHGKNLSGGQRQRIAVARALIHDRSVLLMDETTSALDKANADAVELPLLQNPALTIILISHHLDEARKAMFDKIYDFSSLA